MVVSVAVGIWLGHLQPLIDMWAQAAGVLVATTAPVFRAWEWFEERRKAYETQLAIAQSSKEKLREARIAESIQIADPESDSPAAEFAKITANVAACCPW